MDKIHLSDSKLEEKELEVYFRKIIQNVSEVYFLVDSEKNIQFFNSYATELTRYKGEELKELNFQKLIHPEKFDEVNSGFEGVEEKGIRFEYETTLIDSNYKHIPIELSIKKLEWKEKEIFLVIIRDITKYKRIENDLRVKLDTVLSPEYEITEEEFSSIIDTSRLQEIMDDFYELTNIGIAIEDLKGNVLVSTGWQKICTKFHRIHPETRKNCIESDTHLVEKLQPGRYSIYKCKNNMWDMTTPIVAGGKRLGTLFLGQFFFKDEEIDYEFFKKQAERYGFDKEEYLKAVDDVPRWSRETVNTVMDFYTKFASLISQLSYSNLKLANLLENYKNVERRLREKRRQAKNAFEQSNFYKDLLAHDIANVLNNIKSSVSLIEMMKNDQFEIKDSEEFIQIIKNQINKGSTLISKVRKLSGFEKEDHLIKDINLKEKLRKAISNVESQFKEKNISIKTQLPEQELQVKAGNLLVDAFENILINGVIHNESETKKLWIKVSRVDKDNLPYIKVEIMDNGIGISDMRKKGIFERNYQKKRSKKGMGIGLSLVKKIIDEYGGKISVHNRKEDNYREGSNFVLLLKKK